MANKARNLFFIKFYRLKCNIHNFFVLKLEYHEFRKYKLKCFATKFLLTYFRFNNNIPILLQNILDQPRNYWASDTMDNFRWTSPK